MAPAAPKRLKKHFHSLKVIQEAKPKLRRAILKEADPDLIVCLAECADNLLKGHIPLKAKDINKLKKFKCPVRTLANRKRSNLVKRKLLVQKGGFLPALLTPILSLVGTLLADQITSR